MDQSSKAQVEFDTKSRSFIEYINDNDITISEEILGKKYKSFLRLRKGQQISIDTYSGIINQIEETSKNKIKSKFDYQIINKFKLSEKIDRSEIITFEFNDSQSFFDYMYGIWEQEQETEFMNYKKQFTDFLNREDKDFLKNKFINYGIENSVIPKCDLHTQKDNQARENISYILDNIISPAFRYGFPPGAAWMLKARAFMEVDSFSKLDFLFSKKIKVALGHKLCPQLIRFDEKTNNIFLNTKFIWLIKFGDPQTIEINNLYTENLIFEEFKKTYLSK